MTEPKEAEDLLERAKRWAMNTGWDGNQNSVPMRLIAENAALREKLRYIANGCEGRIDKDSIPALIAKDALTGGDNAEG